MNKYTRQQVINEISDKITTNHNREITGAILNGVLEMMVDREILPNYVNYVHEFLESETVKDALDKLSRQNIPQWLSVKAYQTNYVVLWDDVFYRAKVNVPPGDPNPSVNFKWQRVGGTGQGDYVRLVGDDIINGVKTFMGDVRVSNIKPLIDGGVITINNIPVKNNEIDLGIF